MRRAAWPMLGASKPAASTRNPISGHSTITATAPASSWPVLRSTTVKVVTSASRGAGGETRISELAKAGWVLTPRSVTGPAVDRIETSVLYTCLTMRKVLRLALVLALVGAGGWYYVVQSRPAALVLTGIVTTNDVVIAPQIGGRLVALDVKEGDSVTAGQVLAEIDTGELAADRDYYAHSAESLQSSVREQEAGLRLQRKQLQDQEAQAEASIATTIASRAAAAADVERAKVTFDRTRDLAGSGLAPAQQLDEARTSYTAAQARMESLARQVDRSAPRWRWSARTSNRSRCARARCRPRRPSWPRSARSAQGRRCASGSRSSSRRWPASST